jgi:hypothetical protein
MVHSSDHVRLLVLGRADQELVLEAILFHPSLVDKLAQPEPALGLADAQKRRLAHTTTDTDLERDETKPVSDIEGREDKIKRCFDHAQLERGRACERGRGRDGDDEDEVERRMGEWCERVGRA